MMQWVFTDINARNWVLLNTRYNGSTKTGEAIVGLKIKVVIEETYWYSTPTIGFCARSTDGAIVAIIKRRIKI